MLCMCVYIYMCLSSRILTYADVCWRMLKDEQQASALVDSALMRTRKAPGREKRREWERERGKKNMRRVMLLPLIITGVFLCSDRELEGERQREGVLQGRRQQRQNFFVMLSGVGGWEATIERERERESPSCLLGGRPTPWKAVPIRPNQHLKDCIFSYTARYEESVDLFSYCYTERSIWIYVFLVLFCAQNIRWYADC